MKLIISFLSLLLGLSPILLAQPDVDVCLSKTATGLEVKIRPTTAFVGVVSNIQLAIKCSDPNVTYSTPGNTLTYCTMAKAGDVRPSGGSGYQKFAGFGFFNMSVLGASWVANTEYTLFTVVPSSLSPTFEIATDAWASSNNGVYYAELNGLDQTGTFFVCGSGILAADELELKASALGKKRVQLEWRSHSNQNSSHFILEKQLGEGDFHPIAQLPVNQALSHYQHIDQSLMDEKNRYRVKQMSLDGSYLYSNIEEVRMAATEGVTAFPNPTQQEVTISFRHLQDESWRLSLLNGLGQELYSQKHASSITHTQLNLNGLPEGIYFYRIEKAGQVWEGKLVKASRE